MTLPKEEVNYVFPSEVTEIRVDAETPRNPYPSGYGRKVPTRYMVRLGTRWHRVYVMQYSNSGAAYVIQRGQDKFLFSETEYDLQDASEKFDAARRADK